MTPNIVITTDRRIIIRDPYDLGLKSEIIDIPYDVITRSRRFIRPSEIIEDNR